VKLRSVSVNRRRKSIELRTSTRELSYPFSRLRPAASSADPVARVFVDPEIGREGFTYVLASGKEGTVHVDQVLEYHQDPGFLRDAVLYKLTLEAIRGVEKSPLSRREIIRRLGTSATQFYRLLDPKNTRKSVDQVLRLLHVLDREVDVVVRVRTA
jgi:hypothetical protein